MSSKYPTSILKKPFASDLESAKNTDRKVAFDEENVRMTNKPEVKDYGLGVTIPNTPYPKWTQPIDADQLHNKINQKYVMNQSHSFSSSDSDASTSNNSSYTSSDTYECLCVTFSQCPCETCDPPEVVERKKKFLEKRKKYERGEHPVAQQRIICHEAARPLIVPCPEYELEFEEKEYIQDEYVQDE